MRRAIGKQLLQGGHQAVNFYQLGFHLMQALVYPGHASSLLCGTHPTILRWGKATKIGIRPTAFLP
jgi:hypothetical protein